MLQFQKSFGYILVLTLALVFGHEANSFGQLIELSIPQNDPNQNSSVISSVVFSPDGKLIATSHGMNLGMLQDPKPGQIVLWNAKTGSRLRTFPAITDGVRSVSFSHDGKILAALEFSGIIRLIAVEDGKERLKIQSNRDDSAFYSFVFFPDGKKIAAAIGDSNGMGNDILIIDVTNGKIIRSLSGHNAIVYAMSVSSNGNILASGGMDGTARIWDPTTGVCLKIITIISRSKKDKDDEEELEPWVQSLAISPDGRSLATATYIIVFSAQLDIWDISTGNLKSTLKGIDRYVEQVEYSKDGNLIATAGREDYIKLWNSQNFQEVSKINGIKPIAFSPDGKSIAHGKPTTIMIDGEEITEIKKIVIENIPIGTHQ